MERLHAQLVDMYEACPRDEHGNPNVAEIEINGRVYPFDNSAWPRYRTADRNDKKQMFLDSLRDNAMHLAEILMQKRWSVVFSEEPVFITSDSPVTVLHPEREIFGLATPGTVISFPLSPTRVLLMDDRHDQPKGHYYPLRGSGPGAHNLNAWKNCERFMISSRPTDVVCAEFLAWADTYDV
jgi:hypothetical protein